MSLTTIERECILDTDQPVGVLHKLARGPFSFLLESAVGGERWARYTFIGTEPREAWRYARGRVERWTEATWWQDAGPCPAPLRHAGGLMRQSPVVAMQGAPRFHGGLVGYFGYDVVRTIEHLGPGPADDCGAPDAVLMLADTVLVLDNLLGRARIIATVEENTASRRAAEQKLDSWLERLSRATTLAPLSLAPSFSAPSFSAPYSEDAYKSGVARLKQHIQAGDIFQAVLSRRLEVAAAVDPLMLYRSLRSLNPSPYLYYLALDGTHIVGSSPEVLVRVEQRGITLRPIAGTRPRGAGAIEDEALARALLADPKERAEHVMLVDLGRNDLGRVAEFGSVRVTDNMTIERYAHVQHIVSEVRASLRRGCDAVDALEACFPAGTVSGAPKVRAMQLIDELEPTRRGPYAGAVGYIGWGAERLDTAIAIRTCVVTPGRVYVQSGAGIVADSHPDLELAETEHKARSALEAIAMATP